MYFEVAITDGRRSFHSKSMIKLHMEWLAFVREVNHCTAPTYPLRRK